MVVGFFGLDVPRQRKGQKAGTPKGVSVDMLHRAECKACPLNHATCRSPKTGAMGADKPAIYMLGTAPSEQADLAGRAWAGDSYKIVRRSIPAAVLPHVRWHNVIRTHPGNGPPIQGATVEIDLVRPPTFVELEACRPSVIKDIEQSKPKAIFGFGGVVLKWAANETHAYQWMSRRIPVKIGTHTCWYYPFVLPEDHVKDIKWENHTPDSLTTFENALLNACKEVMHDDLPAPYIHTDAEIMENIESITGAGGNKDLARVERFLSECVTMKNVGMDYETNALRPYRKTSKILSVALSHKDKTQAIAWQHREAKWTDAQLDDLWKMFREFLMTKGPRKIAHQLAFEMEWSAYHFGKDVLRAGSWGDSISQAFVINETQGLLALEALTMQYFGFNIKDKSPVDRKNLDAEPLANVLTYNGADAKYHRELFLVQQDVLRDLNLMEVYQHHVSRVPTLVLTTMKGIPINQETVKDFRKDYDAEVADVEKELAKLPDIKKYRAAFGTDYRPTASGDVAKMLKLLGHKLTKTEKGGDATDEKNLKRFDDAVVKLTLRHRKASKVLSTYMDSITEGSEHLYDGRVHPIISTCKVRTSRTSSEDPNVQNWPNRGPAVVIRKSIDPGIGYKVVSFDYAGIQARNVAMESRDRRLIKAFIDSYDIHADWVEKLAKLCPRWAHKGLATDKKMFKDARAGVKNQFVFPTFFGASPRSIAPNLSGSGRTAPPVEVVIELQETFFGDFPEIKQWHEKIQKFYKKNGYVTGLSGYRRHAPIGYNEIINSPIQADETIIVMSAMNALSEKGDPHLQAIMEIHDDLTFILPTKKIDHYAPIIIREMVKVRYDWINPVPLEVEMSVGNNWGDKEEVGKFENVGIDGDYRQK